MSRLSTRTPLVYSCSGCSSAAQMANHLAVQLDRAGIAEMSCIAGVGGDVPGLLRIARSGRPILALDGCAMRCAAACLARAGLQADLHFTLSDCGVRKLQHADFDHEQATAVLVGQLLPGLRALAARREARDDGALADGALADGASSASQ